LVQLVDVIDAETLFRDYVYVTGTSQTMALHFERYAQDVVSSLGLGREDLVVEVASNDGTLLGYVQALGPKALGVEPARNIAKLARERGIETIDEFFCQELAVKLRAERGGASAVLANNVLAHVDGTRDFLAGAAELLSDNGRLVTEFPHLEPMLDGLEYDTVYHEHVCYFSILALLPLFSSSGLSIQRVDRMPVHGGSLRVWAARRSTLPDHAGEVLRMAENERGRRLADPRRFEEFASAVRAHRESLRGLLERLKREGALVAAHSAPAKGNTLLNYCGIDSSLVRYIVDKNPMKVGTWTPGTHIPVSDPSRVEAEPPDYLLILAWNLAEEIMRQQKAFSQRGGKFILPLPEPRIV
jgi:SAM-dependent methyltransferase